MNRGIDQFSLLVAKQLFSARVDQFYTVLGVDNDDRVGNGIECRRDEVFFRSQPFLDLPPRYGFHLETFDHFVIGNDQVF